MFIPELLKVDYIGADNNGTLGSLSHFLSDSSTAVPTYPPPVGDYGACDFPRDTEAENRRNNSDCSCDDIGVSMYWNAN